MKDRWAFAVFALAVGSAVVLMLPAMTAGPLVLDEHAAYWLCAGDVGLSIAERNLNYAATPPMASWAQAASIAVLGKTELALRFPSLALYVLAIATIFLGSRPVIGVWPAALASLALAWHPDVVDEVRIGRQYGLTLFAMSASLVATLRLIAAERRPAEIGWGVISGLLAATALWTHVLTIPVLGCTAVMLLIADFRQRGRPRIGTMLGLAIATVAAVQLLPMLLRMWSWREALNYQTGTASIGSVLGPFVCVAIPVGLLMFVVGRFRKVEESKGQSTSQTASHGFLIVTGFVVGVLPLVVLVVMSGELASLNNPRYRVPLAAAQAMLLGLLLARGRRVVGLLTLLVVLVGCWTMVGVGPLTLKRVGTVQASVWQEIGETLRQRVEADGLEQAPVFVQSGLIEGTLVPVMAEDVGFHGYLGSRVGRFYADVPNPRYGLPFFWHINAAETQATFRSFIEAAPGKNGDLFVAAALDTDVNRSSLAGFVALLEKMGYELTPLADHEPWAVLYHARQK